MWPYLQLLLGLTARGDGHRRASSSVARFQSDQSAQTLARANCDDTACDDTVVCFKHHVCGVQNHHENTHLILMALFACTSYINSTAESQRMYVYLALEGLCDEH